MPKKKTPGAPPPSFRQTVVVDIFPDAVSLSLKMSTVGTNLQPANDFFKQLAALLGYDASIRDHRTAAQRRVPKIKPARLVGFVKFKPGAAVFVPGVPPGVAGGPPPRV